MYSEQKHASIYRPILQGMAAYAAVVAPMNKTTSLLHAVSHSFVCEIFCLLYNFPA